MYKTTQMYQYIHDVATKDSTTPKKGGKPSRPARGNRIGVVVAKVLDSKTYGIHVSLTNPMDEFDKDIALNLALGKLVVGEKLPDIIVKPYTTKRARNIKTQFDTFSESVAIVFKDKKPCALNSFYNF